MQALGCSITPVSVSRLAGSPAWHGCLSARAMDTGFPIVVWCLCLGRGSAWVWASVTPPALAGVLGACVCVRLLVLPLFSQLGFAVFGGPLGFRPAPHLSWLGFRGVCGCVRAPPVPRCSWFGCAVLVYVFRFGFQLRPATPRGGVGMRVCLCARPAWSPAPSGWGCGAEVRAWASAAAAPATPGWVLGRVCVCVRSACTPPFLAGVCRVNVRA